MTPMVERAVFMVGWSRQLREDATALCQRSAETIARARLVHQAARDERALCRGSNPASCPETAISDLMAVGEADPVRRQEHLWCAAAFDTLDPAHRDTAATDRRA
jgi:hypothetical protein